MIETTSNALLTSSLSTVQIEVNPAMVQNLPYSFSCWRWLLCLHTIYRHLLVHKTSFENPINWHSISTGCRCSHRQWSYRTIHWCRFCKKGKVHGTVAMDPVKLAGVWDWPTPCNVTEVKSFLGFLNFYWWFVDNFSHIARPLNQLTKLNTPWTQMFATS